MPQAPEPGTLQISLKGAANTIWNMAATTGGLQPPSNEPHYASRRQNVLAESDFPDALRSVRGRIHAFNKMGMNTHERSDISTQYAALPNFHETDRGQGRVFGCYMIKPSFFERRYVQHGKFLAGVKQNLPTSMPWPPNSIWEFAVANSYARRNGYVGAFPTFDDSSSANEFVLLPDTAAVREYVPAYVIGVESGLYLLQDEANGPFEKVDPVFSKEPLTVGFDFPLEAPALFRRLNGYAHEKGFAMAFPTYLNKNFTVAVDSLGPVLTLESYEIVFLKSEAVKWLDVHWEIATVLGSTPVLTDVLVHESAIQPTTLAIDVLPYPDELDRDPISEDVHCTSLIALESSSPLLLLECSADVSVSSEPRKGIVIPTLR